MGQRVLVVDDDPTVGDVVCRYLRQAGYAATLAADGPAALAAAGAGRPAVSSWMATWWWMSAAGWPAVARWTSR